MSRRGLLFLLCTAVPACATSINWTINATLSDGATVTGSFVFDPDLGSQTITNFDISVSAATPGTLIEPGDDGLPTSVFFPFEFIPSNSEGAGPVSFRDGAFQFRSIATFINPKPGFPAEDFDLDFVPLSPLTDLSSTTITNSTIAVNDANSVECFNCNPYVCYAGATSALCVGNATGSPEPRGWALSGLGMLAFCGWAWMARRRPRPNFIAQPRMWSRAFLR